MFYFLNVSAVQGRRGEGHDPSDIPLASLIPTDSLLMLINEIILSNIVNYRNIYITKISKILRGYDAKVTTMLK